MNAISRDEAANQSPRQPTVVKSERSLRGSRQSDAQTDQAQEERRTQAQLNNPSLTREKFGQFDRKREEANERAWTRAKARWPNLTREQFNEMNL